MRPQRTESPRWLQSRAFGEFLRPLWSTGRRVQGPQGTRVPGYTQGSGYCRTWWPTCPQLPVTPGGRAELMTATASRGCSGQARRPSGPLGAGTGTTRAPPGYRLWRLAPEGVGRPQHPRGECPREQGAERQGAGSQVPSPLTEGGGPLSLLTCGVGTALATCSLPGPGRWLYVGSEHTVTLAGARA